MKNKKKLWKSAIKNEWKKPLIAISTTATIGSVSLITVGLSSSSNNNQDKLDKTPTTDELETNKEKPVNPEDPLNPQEEGEAGGESGGGGGGGSGGGGGGGSSGGGGGGGGGSSSNEGDFSTRPNVLPTLQSRFETWKKEKGSKVKSLYQKHSSYSSNLQAFNNQEKEKWANDDQSKVYIDNWKSKKKDDILKPEFTGSNDYSKKLKNYIDQEVALSQEQWLTSNLSTGDYENWINNHKFDLETIWKTTDHYTNSQSQNKSQWLASQSAFNTKNKFLSTNDVESFYEKWINANNDEISKKWQATTNYQSFYNSTKAALLNNPEISTKEKFANSDESNPFYTSWVSKNLLTFKNSWKTNDDYDKSFEKYKSYWKKQNPNLDTVDKYIATNKSGVDINAWKTNNLEAIKKYWMSTDEFTNLFDTFKRTWKSSNPTLDTKAKFANSNVANNYYQTWRNQKPESLINEFKKDNIYTSNYNAFFTSFKLSNPQLDTKDKFLNSNNANSFYDQWRVQRPKALADKWKKTLNYTQSLISYKRKWKQNNPSLDTKEKYALSSYSDTDYGNWILNREDGLKQKWLTTADFKSALGNFKTNWQAANSGLSTKEKFAENNVSNAYYNKWVPKNYDALKVDWLKSDSEDNLLAAYKTEFIKQKTNKNTITKWIDNDFYNKIKYLSWQNSQVEDILQAWKQDGNKFSNAFNNFKTNWKQNNPDLDSKQKFGNHDVSIPFFEKYKSAHPHSSMAFWKTTNDYTRVLNNYTDKYIAQNGKSTLASKTTDDQYNDWVSNKSQSEVDNWVKFSKTQNPNFIRYRSVWMSNNPKSTYLDANFPSARFEKWKQAKGSFQEEWKKDLAFKKSLQKWIEQLPAEDQNLATSKYLGKNDQIKSYHLKYLEQNLKTKPAYYNEKYAKFKTWIENNDNPLLNKFKDNFILQNPQYGDVVKFFYTRQSDKGWKKWFKSQIDNNQSLKSNYLSKWENKELTGVDDYDDAYSEYTKRHYTLNDFITQVKTNSTLENTAYNDYKNKKINETKNNSLYNSKQRWILTLPPDHEDNLFGEYLKTKPKAIMDEYYASQDYQDDYKRWEANIPSSSTYSTIEKYNKNHLPKGEKVTTDRRHILTKYYSDDEITKFREYLTGKDDKSKETIRTKNYFWNFDTYIASEPEEFKWYLYSVIREWQYIPTVSKFEFETEFFPKLTIKVPKGQTMYVKNILEQWLRKRIGSGYPELLPYGRDDVDMKHNYAFLYMNLKNIDKIVEHIFDPTHYLFQLREEFHQILKIMVPSIRTWNVTIPTKHNYIRGGMDAVRNRGDSDPTTKDWGYRVWYNTKKSRTLGDKFLIPNHSIRFKRNIIIWNLEKAKLKALKPKYDEFKKKKFRELVDSEAYSLTSHYGKFANKNKDFLVTQEYWQDDHSTRDYERYMIYQSIINTFGNSLDGLTYQSTVQELSDLFKKRYLEVSSVTLPQYNKMAHKKIKNHAIFNETFEKYLYQFANRRAVNNIYSIGLNDPTTADRIYKDAMIDFYYKNADLNADFENWWTNTYSLTNDFVAEYNQSLLAQIKFKDNLIKEYMKSPSVQKDYENWKKALLNLKTLYKKTDDADDFYESEIQRIYFSDVVDKTTNFNNNLQNRSIGQFFYELSGQAKKDLATNLDSEYDGSDEQNDEFTKFKDSQNNVLTLYKASNQLTTDYDSYIESEYKKTAQFKNDMDQWINEGTNGLDLYKNSSLASDHFNEYIKQHFTTGDSIVENFVQTWSATKANGLNTYKKASSLEDDYNHYIDKEFKKDATFNDKLDLWSANKANGLSIYETSLAVETSYDDFLLNKFTNEDKGFNHWLDEWSATKANGLDIYKASAQSSSDYDTFIGQEFQKSITFNVEYNNWSSNKANGISTYLNSDQLTADYEQHLLDAYKNGDFNNQFQLWASDINNIWDSYSKGDNASQLYDAYIKTQFDSDTTKQNQYLLEWSLDKSNWLSHYKTTPQSDTDYATYLDQQIANASTKNQHFMLWAKNTQAIIDDYANDNSSDTDYQKYIDEQYAKSNQQGTQDFNLWTQDLLSNKTKGIGHYKNANTASTDYQAWKDSNKRSEDKYKLNHVGQFDFDFNDWLEDKSNFIDLYNNDSTSIIDFQTWSKSNPGSLQNYVDSQLYNNHLDSFVENVLTWDKYGSLFTSEKWGE